MSLTPAQRDRWINTAGYLQHLAECVGRDKPLIGGRKSPLYIQDWEALAAHLDNCTCQRKLPKKVE